MAKENRKIQYYLDETDQIEVDGHTLSRLYLAPGVVDTSDGILTRYAVYGEDNTNKWMGGYVESVDNLSHDITGRGWVAWVNPNSTFLAHLPTQMGFFMGQSPIPL